VLKGHFESSKDLVAAVLIIIFAMTRLSTMAAMLAGVVCVQGATKPAPAPAAAAGPAAAPTTCGGLKQVYKDNACCGNPAKAVSVAPPCPYNFNKPACAKANVQAPRDLSTGATGTRIPKMATLTKAQQQALPLSNVHYHLGAEHKSDMYSDEADSKAFDAAAAGGGHRRLSANPRPGYMCSKAGLTSGELTPYTFAHCKGDVTVGKSYEVHYVHSSAGYTAADTAAADVDLMNDGLGGAANGRGQLNPMVVVQAQVYQIVNDPNSPAVADALHGWTVTDFSNSVMYPGSTTGPSHSNSVCSPYAITWHVDKACNKIAAASFDNLCKMMKDLYKLDGDLYPHGSRLLLDPKWVCPAVNVLALA